MVDVLQLHQTAAAATRAAEVEQCKEWAAAGSYASAVERAYAAAVLGNSEEGSGFGSGGKSVTPGQLQLFGSDRERIMDRYRQQRMQQLVTEAEAAAAAAHGHCASTGSGASAAVSGLSLSVDPPIPVQRFRVTGVLPQFSSSSNDTSNGLTNSSSSSSIGQLQQQQHGQAIVKAWRAAEVVQQLEEGLVVLAVALAAGNEGRSSTVDLGGMGRPMVELNTSNMTR
jgi:hypothetical protein